MFKDYVKNYATELEKGQFDKILNMDLAQNDNEENKDIFIHGLPTIAVFNDGGIKRAWNFIIGIIDHQLISQTKSITKNVVITDFIQTMDISNGIQSKYHTKKHGIELEILGVWPYAVGGYLRVITPEVATYTYPPYQDAKKTYGKQRCVLLLDVLDKLYSNNMRQIGIQRLIDSDIAAKLITLQSTIKYLNNLLSIEHEYFHNRNEYQRKHTLKQGLFIRLTAFIGCIDDDDKKNNDENKYGCLLSGVMYNIIEGINRNNQYSLLFLAVLKNEGLVEWIKKPENNKDVMSIMDNGKDVGKRLKDKTYWNELKGKYFDNDGNDDKLDEILKQFVNNKDEIKLYKRAIRHVTKYSIVRRPGEDTFVLP